MSIYTTAINDATNAYAAVRDQINKLAGPKDLVGSLEHSNDALATAAANFRGADKKAQDYDTIKKALVVLSGELVDQFPTVEKAANLAIEQGLAAVKTMQTSMTTLNASSKTPATQDGINQKEATRGHFIALLSHNSKGKDAESKIKEWETSLSAETKTITENEAALSANIAKIQAQLPVLKAALDTTLYNLKAADGQTGIRDMVPDYSLGFGGVVPNYSYLNEALKNLELKEKSVTPADVKIAI